MSWPLFSNRRNLFLNSPRTPGPLGQNDAADPDCDRSIKGPTPGSLGMNDYADPAHLLDGELPEALVVKQRTSGKVPMPVEDICKGYIKDPAKVANCNEFLQAVAAKVGSEWGVNLTEAFAGNADSIRTRFGTRPFVFIGPYPDKATEFANAGQFVVGGLTHAEMTYIDKNKKPHIATMGHVVVVVPGGPSSSGNVTLTDGTFQPVRGGYPYCYQGAARKAFRFKERTQVDVVFPATLLNKVEYAYIDIQKKQ